MTEVISKKETERATMHAMRMGYIEYLCHWNYYNKKAQVWLDKYTDYLNNKKD